MRLTTKGRYAVTAMLDLAIQGENQASCLADISARQGISLSYLEQLFSKLRKRGLVCSLRGPGGGYKLDQAADHIFVADIIAAVDEHVDATKCQGKADCQDGGQCITHELWSELSDQIQLFLSNISLSELVQRHYKKHGHTSAVTVLDINQIQTATVR